MDPGLPVTLCIVNYNGERHLKNAIRGVVNQEWVFGEILVVDNASTDRSLDVLQEACPQAKVLRLSENRGPAAARNAGFVAADNDLILFQDNDIEIAAGVVSQLTVHLARHPEALLVTPRVVHADKQEIVQCDSADCHFLGLMVIRNANACGARLNTQPAETTSMAAGCFLIDRSRWSGGPLQEEHFGFNLEDHDLGVRARLFGHTLWVVPNALVTHGSGTPNLSYREGSIPSDMRLFYLARNRWMILATCFAGRTIAVLSPALLVYELMQLTWFVATGRALVWCRAVASTCRLHSYLHRRRTDVQAMRRTPDRDFLTDADLPLTGYVRGNRVRAGLIALADGLLRGYWRLACRWAE